MHFYLVITCCLPIFINFQCQFVGWSIVSTLKSNSKQNEMKDLGIVSLTLTVRCGSSHGEVLFDEEDGSFQELKYCSLTKQVKKPTGNLVRKPSPFVRIRHNDKPLNPMLYWPTNGDRTPHWMVTSSKFPLQPHQKYSVTQCEEPGFS